MGLAGLWFGTFAASATIMGQQTSVLLVLFGCVLSQAGCFEMPDTYSTIQLVVDGSGQITSRDGTFNCAADSTGACEIQMDVGPNDGPTTASYALCAEPSDTSFVFDGWELIVDADCPSCGTADPEMGEIETHGNEADLRIDMNAGYDVDELVTARFVPSGATGTPASTTGISCW